LSFSLARTLSFFTAKPQIVKGWWPKINCRLIERSDKYYLRTLSHIPGTYHPWVRIASRVRVFFNRPFIATRTLEAMRTQALFAGLFACPRELTVAMIAVMSVPTAAILVIGDEILSGKTDDRNARLLIGELRDLGVALRRIVVIPDDVEDVARNVRELSTQFDHVFTSGGVGPTHDDVTIIGIALAFEAPVVRHPELESRIRGFFGEDADESRLRMADVPSGSELIDAPDLRWPMLACRNVYILPGVPEHFERKFMAIRERFRVAPFFARAIYTLQDEFDIAETLRTVADAHPQVAVGSYPSFSAPDYRVKVTLESKDGPALESASEALMAILDREKFVRSE
jgi:molybdenum cofactor synthesis domain-containing protein